MSDELAEPIKAMHDNKNVGFDEGEYFLARTPTRTKPSAKA